MPPKELIANPISFLYQQALSYLVAAWSRRWYGLVTVWLVCVAGWFSVAQMPDWYTASARIYVDTQSLLRPLLRGMVVENNVFQQIDFIQRTLLSRPNMEKLARMTDLDLTATSTAGNDNLIDGLRQRISIASNGGDLFTISYKGANPAVAKSVVQSLLTLFVESNLGLSRRDMDVARQFLDEQIKGYEKQLKDAETRLADFKKENMGYLPGEDADYYSRMERERGTLASTEAQLNEAISQRQELSKQLADMPETLDSGEQGGPPSDLTERILGLEKTLDSLLLQYTDKHPDVIAVRRQIANLKKQLQDENEARAASQSGSEGGKPSMGAPNPVYQQVKLRIVELDGLIASLRSRVAQQRVAVEKLAGQAKTVPEIEAQLVSLNRDYGIIRKNYEELLSRREAAKIAEDVDTKGDKVNFRVIDPPVVPASPSGPDRPTYLTMVLLAGLGAGAVIALFLGQLRDVFSDLQSLKERYDFPVLGSVSAVLSSSQRRRRLLELACFGLVFLGLIGAYGGLMVIEVATKFPGA
jgi:polysaccharide chain length determinant protein (PEP-CTERM system associated)